MPVASLLLQLNFQVWGKVIKMIVVMTCVQLGFYKLASQAFKVFTFEL